MQKKLDQRTRVPKWLFLPILLLMLAAAPALAWNRVPVKDDPLVRMPGTQPAPENNPDIESPTRCTNCHGLWFDDDEAHRMRRRVAAIYRSDLELPDRAAALARSNRPAR